jgi:hypothetical protein
MTIPHPRQSVGQIVWAGFILTLLLLAAIAAVSYESLRLSERSSTRLADESVVRAAIATNMERSLAAVQYDLTVYSLAQKPSAFEDGQQRLGAFERYLGQARSLGARFPEPTRSATAVRALQAALPEFRRQVQQLHALRAAIATRCSTSCCSSRFRRFG